MLSQILLGLLMTAFTIGFGATTLVAGAEPLQRYRQRLFEQTRFVGHVLTLILVSTWLVFGMLIVIAVWALILSVLGVFGNLETALYFSLISFTTVGYGEVVPPVEWRILAGFIAVDGFMLFGLNTAFIFEVLRRMRDTSGSE